MNDLIFALYRHMVEKKLYLQYLSPSDRDEYQANLDGSSAALQRLRASLEGLSKKELDIFLDENLIVDSMEAEAIFTAGLAVGLQLLRLS